MKAIFQISLAVLLASCFAAPAQPQESWQKTLRAYEWSDAKLTGGEITTTNGVSMLKVQNTNGTPMEVTLLTITNASLIAKANAIAWEMKYEEVQYGHVLRPSIGAGSIQTLVSRFSLLEHIPPQVSGGDETTNTQSVYYSGSANWKPAKMDIVTPFGFPSPTQLQLNLYLPTNGTFYFRPLKLVGSAATTSWWTSQQAGLIGGIGGSLIGCLGALVGILGSKGRARGLVLATVKCCIALGLVSLAGGVTALALKQPYAVYYPLLLGGFILTIVFSVNLPAIQRRYDELEIRRMASEDAMRG